MRRATRTARAAAVLAALALATLPRAAHANPLDMFGFGARAGGMAGAQTAATNDVGANHANPAALAAARAIEIDFGSQLARPRLEMNGGDQKVDDAFGWTLGLVVPGKVLGHAVAFGIATYVPDAHVTRTRALPAQLPRWVMYDNRPQRLFLGFNVAFALGSRVLVGGGVGFMARLVGDLNLVGRVGFPTPDDSELALDIDVNLRSIRYPQLGVLVHATPWLDVGAVYRGGFTLKIDQTLRIDGDVGASGAEPIVDDGFLSLHSVSLDHFQPTQIAVGFAARLTSRFLLAGDVTWQRWSVFENPAANIDLELDLKDFNEQVMIPDALPLPGSFFHDIFVPRLGAEVLVARGAHTTWRARGGYAYEPSPVPEQQGETNFIDNDKHTFTLGAGVEVAKVSSILLEPFFVDVSAGMTVLPAREHRKIRAADPVGDIEARGVVWQLAISTRWQF